MSAARRYVAHAPHGRAHLIAEADSFVEAAMLYAERWHPTHDETEGLVAVTVIDASNGEQHCFAIDLDTGEAGPCEVATSPED